MAGNELDALPSLADDAAPNARGRLSDGGAPDTAPDTSGGDASSDTHVDADADAGAPRRDADGGGAVDATSRQCTAPARICDGKVPESCDPSGQWQRASACPHLCIAGDCAGVCTPGDTACAGPAPETCDATGAWTVAAPCPFACSNGACVGRCTPGSYQCVGATRQLCDPSGQWQDDLACPFVCVGADCGGVCIPGRNQCVAGAQQTCSANGTWQTVSTPERELLVNPGFENAETGWTNPGIRIVNQATNVNANNAPEITAQSPTNLAWFGGINRQDDLLSQDVAIPAGAAALTFSFYYAIFTRENSAAENDVMDVSVIAGNQVVPLAHFSDNDAVEAWTRASVALPLSLVGQTVTLQLHSSTNGSMITSFYIDTLSLQAAVCP
jgi:hypothetical protein